MGFGIGTGDEGVSLRWLGDWNVVLTIVLGIVSVFHAFRVRNEYLMRLAGVQGTKRKKDEILKRLLRNEGSLRREGQQRTTFASEEASSYKDLLSVCSKHTRNDWSGYYVGEKIPLKKMVNAFTYYPIPDDERIVALLDSTTFGSGRTGLAICERGIYWRNRLLTEHKKGTFLPWDDFRSVHVEKGESKTVALGEGNIFETSGAEGEEDRLVELLSDVQTLLRIDAGITRTAEVSEQNDETVEKVPPSRPNHESEKPRVPPKEPEDTSSTPVTEPPLDDIDNPPRKVVPERLGITSILTNYPLPLAYSYRLANAEFETFRVLKELYRNAEGLTAFLASLALVLAPTPTGKRRDTLLWAWRGKGATFGSWYAILEKTTPTIEEDKGHLYRSMQQLLGTKANPSSFAETMTWLIDRRNDLHHGDLPVGPRADLLIQEVRSRFEHCVSESAALWQHPLRLVLDYDAVRNKDYVVATCLDFSGDHPVGRKVQERYQGIPKKQDLYILQDGKQWISLYPFISVHYCPHCNARETYYVDAWQGTGEEANLRSFERSHEEVSEEIGQELTLRLGS